ISDSVGGAIALAPNSAAPVTFYVRDVNGNVMPGGTTIALSASGAGLSVAQPSSFSVPCTTVAAGVQFPGITVFSYTVTSSADVGSGVVTLTVTTPQGLVTTYQIGVTVQ